MRSTSYSTLYTKSPAWRTPQLHSCEGAINKLGYWRRKCHGLTTQAGGSDLQSCEKLGSITDLWNAQKNIDERHCGDNAVPTSKKSVIVLPSRTHKSPSRDTDRLIAAPPALDQSFLAFIYFYNLKSHAFNYPPFTIFPNRRA